MSSPSLRSWLGELEAAGQLKHVTAEVDWDQEIGALARINLALGGPALLFENMIGCRFCAGARFPRACANGT